MKKILVFLTFLTILCCFTACDRSIDTVESDEGVEYIVVRDENGDIVINENDKLQVYVINENGKKQKNDNGDFITEFIDFNGQVVIDNVVETQEMRFTLPDSFVADSENPGYFYYEAINAEIFISYYGTSVENAVSAQEKNCESLLESYGSDVFEYKKYTAEADKTDCVAFKQRCISSEYYKNSYSYYIPYDNGFYLVDCLISTDNEKKVDFDKFINSFEIK